ncbi:hypothetical protein AB833_07415 [Chromatiales bacterium (ex Bugula neritina AB1)]|nr:hypothetical protein AB833_07415 [Chromatiales bacterium (ex Bugula neritina AB1)]
MSRLLLAFTIISLAACGSGSSTNSPVEDINDGENPLLSDPVSPPPQTDSPVAPVIAAGSCSPPPAGSTLVSETTPVRSTGNNYYPDMGPQCVYPASQFDGPGLGYGNFLIINNAWNGQTSSADWSQCITLNTAADGSVNPSWNYNWGNEDDLKPGYFEWEVKSYPEVIYGAKSSTEMSAPCSSTGLPAPVSQLPDLSIAYSYRSQQSGKRVGDRGDENNNPTRVTGGDRNVAIESFFHSSCEISRGSNSNIELELMVWLEVGNERLPSGSAPEFTYTSRSGELYDVYTKPGAGNYLAYVAKNPVRNGTLSWSEFIDDARANAGNYDINAVKDSWCLANVIFGSEIWWGEGSINLDYYQITRQY